MTHLPARVADLHERSGSRQWGKKHVDTGTNRGHKQSINTRYTMAVTTRTHLATSLTNVCEQIVSQLPYSHVIGPSLLIDSRTLKTSRMFVLVVGECVV